jgi:hypothetical protein
MKMRIYWHCAMDVRKLQELSELFCVATTLNNLLDHMQPEQAAFVLRVPEDANEATINKAFRHLAKMYHPDVSTGSDLKFKLLNKARKVMLENVEPENNVVSVDFEELVNRPKAVPVAPEHNKSKPIWGDWYSRDLERK